MDNMMTVGLKSFFEAELANYRENVRNGNIDPADGYHPTLSSAIDSLLQAPEDVVFDWFGADADGETEPYANLAYEYLMLANMVCVHGPTAKLTDLVE